MRRRVNRALQLRDQVGYGPVQLVRDMTNGSPILRLLRANPDGLKESRGMHVVAVRHKWHRHPAADRLIRISHAPRLPAGPVSEKKRARNRQYEGEPHRQRPLPGLPHTFKYTRFPVRSRGICAMPRKRPTDPRPW